MDEQRQKKIAELAAKAHDAAERYRMLGMMSTAGKTPDELRQQSVEYALAAAEAADARRALDETIGAADNPQTAAVAFAGLQEKDRARTLYVGPSSNQNVTSADWFKT